MSTAANITAPSVTVEVPSPVILNMLCNAFDSSAILYWLRRAEAYDPEFDDEQTEANSKLYGNPGDNHEVKWPDGFDEDAFDPASLPWMDKDDLPWEARVIYFAPLIEGAASRSTSIRTTRQAEQTTSCSISTRSGAASRSCARRSCITSTT